jgi:hypothetical protein
MTQLNINTFQLFIKAMSQSSSRRIKEQRKADKLLTRRLPPIVAAQLKEYKVTPIYNNNFNNVSVII